MSGSCHNSLGHAEGLRQIREAERRTTGNRDDTMSRLHDYRTGKVKRDEEKKKRDAVIEEQKKFEKMLMDAKASCSR